MKTSPFLLSMTVAATLITALPAAAPVRAQASAGAPQTFAYAFQDADVTQVLQEILGNGLGMSYRIDPRVSGRISFRIEQRLTREQLLAAVESALAQYNIVIIRDGGTLLVRPRDDAPSGVAVSNVATTRAGYQVRAIPVRYGAATEIAKALEALSHDKIVFFSSDSLGLIVLGGTSEELESASRTVAVFDQNALSDARIRFFPLTSSDAATVSGDLGRILAQAGLSGVHLAPMRRLNGIYAFARSGDVLDKVGDFVRRLDVPSQDPTLKVAVYHPRGATAESLARTLNQVLGLSQGQDMENTLSLDAAPRPTQGVTASPAANTKTPATETVSETSPVETAEATVTRGSGEARVVADRNANLVVIAGPEALRVRALSILNDIDREPTQVFIEASILEVTLNDEFSFGVDWSALKGAGTISNFTSDATTFPVAAPGLTISYLKNDIKAAITALSSHSRVLVLSAPKITTRENVQAVLKIGDEVPIITQTAQSTTVGNAPVINSVSYKDTGVMLEVTPHVMAGNRVSLDVVQEVSSVQKTVTSGIDSPTIHQRNLQSSLIVPEDTVVALGGLISSTHNTGDTGAPGLSKVPLLGNLFKSQTNNSARTELIVLLKARVLRGDDAFGHVLGNLDADMKELSATGLIDVP